LHTKNIEILERLQWLVVQSVMRVRFEKSEFVKREDDGRDEKRATRVPFLSLFAGRKSILRKPKISFFKSKFDSFSNRKLTLFKPKIISSSSFLDRIKSAIKGVQPFKSAFSR
jgi:hypothetical protein